MAQINQTQSEPSNIVAAGRLHYAWVVAGVTFFVLLITAGTRTAAGVFIIPLEEAFGWSRSAISGAVAISIFWFGAGGPIAGPLIDRFGPRRIMLVGLALVALGLGLMTTMTSLWQLHFFWGAIVGIGTGSVANVMGATIAQRWFRKHRGVIIGLFGAASAAGQLIFQPSMMSLTETYGWRSAIIVATVAVAMLWLPVLIFMRDTPEQMRLRPYGDLSTDPPESAVALRRTPLAEAIRTRDFWLLAGSFFVCGWTTNGLIQTHLLPHAIEHGFHGTVAAQAIGIMGLMNIVGTLASGWLSDRYDNRLLLMSYYGLRACSIALLPFVYNLSGFTIFAIIYGLDWIATVPPTINLTAQRFGRGSVGTLYGWIFFAHMVGAAIAAQAGGFMHDLFGDYTLAFFSAALLGLIAAAFSLGITPAQRVQVAPQS
jgi:sugar phosphate permease